MAAPDGIHCPSALVETMHFQCKTFSCEALRLNPNARRGVSATCNQEEA